jgi:cell pole-organizing protein PopZ
MDLTSASVAMTDGVENVALDDLEELTTPHSHTQTNSRAPALPGPSRGAQLSAKVAQSRTFTKPAGIETTSHGHGFGQLDPVRAEEVLREQVREVLEAIAWKIIPDIAERVVREEIQRILKEAERL